MDHLLRRAGFGGTADEIEAADRVGWAATVDALLTPPAEDEFPDLTSVDGHPLDFDTLDGIKSWWTYRLVHTRHPLVEKMTLFWHGHFATSDYKVSNPRLLWQQNQTFRRLVFGDFRDLLLEMARDPAMLIWLDGQSNHLHAPNENWARELMELFTIGIGLFNEQDVSESARAFTGWGLRDGRSFFDPHDHVPGDKHFLGRAVQSGDEVIHILADLPQAGTFLADKLFAFFGLSPAPPSAVQKLADVYRTSHRNIEKVLRTLFLSDEFRTAGLTHIKSPAEFVLGCVHLTGAMPPIATMHNAMTQMGQELFNPPTVKGWDPDMAWISASAMVERFRFAALVAAQAGDVRPETLVQGPIHPERAALLGQSEGKERTYLAMCLPEFQFS